MKSGNFVDRSWQTLIVNLAAGSDAFLLDDNVANNSNCCKLSWTNSSCFGTSGQWIDCTLQEALNDVEDGNMSIRGASKFYNIPVSSLADHLYGRTTHRKKGAKGVLTEQRTKKFSNGLNGCKM